jgi:predicted dehydrogenase
VSRINKILIVGLGSIGRRHFSIAKKKFPQAQIKILRSKIKKDNFNNEVSFYKLKDAIDFDPQIVVIANPATFHISSAIPFLKKNRYLFIEKPLSHDLDKAKIFLKNCENKKTFVQVGYNLRFLSSLKAFKNFLDKKLIGDIWSIKSVVGQYLPSWRPKNNYKKSVSSSKIFGGGVVNELSHEIDYLLWIFGDI